MSVRSAMNKKPVITIVIAVAVVGAAVWMAFRSVSPPQMKDAVFFTADDGQTWFADKTDTVTPYTKDGKQVVRAYVFKCKDGKPFVAYMTRLNPSVADKAGASTADKMARAAGKDPYDVAEMEYKRPGDSSWEKYGKMSAESRAKLAPGCADGDAPEVALP